MAVIGSYASSSFGNAGSGNQQWLHQNSAGKWYCVMRTTFSDLRVYKATDPNSSWSEILTGSRPNTGGVLNQCVALQLSANQLMVIHGGTDAGGNFSYWSRLLNITDGSEAWGTVAKPVDNVDSGAQRVVACLADNGDPIMFYQGPQEKVMGTNYQRVYYRRYAGGVWGSENAVSATGDMWNYYPIGCCRGSSASNRLHFIYWHNGSLFIQHSVLSGGTLQAVQTIGSDPQVTFSTSAGGVRSVDEGSDNWRIYVPYEDATNHKLSVASALSATTPSWSNQAGIGTAGGVAGDLITVAAGDDGTNLYIVRRRYHASTPGRHYYTKPKTSGTWGGETTLSNTGTGSAAHAAIITNSGTKLAYWWASSTPDYNYSEVSAGAAEFAAALTGTATRTAALTTAIPLAAARTGAATSTAALTTAITLATARTGTASTTAALTTAIAMAGSASGTASTTAALTTAIPLAADSTGAATASGDLTTAIAMAAASTGTASTTAALTTAISLAADATGSADVVADLTVISVIEFEAAVTGTGSASADLTTAIALAVDLTGAASATAEITTAIPVAADVSGTAATTADLTTTITLAVDLTGSGASTADLTTAIPLDAVVTGAATATADLTTAIALAVDLTGAVTSTASLTAAIAFASDVSGTAVVTSDLTTAIPLDAVVTGTATTTADLTTAIALDAVLAATASVYSLFQGDRTYPRADLGTPDWLPSSGGDLYLMVDEEPASDADYIYSGSVDGNACELDCESVYSLPTGDVQVALRWWRE